MSSGANNILKNNENILFILNPSITHFKSVYRKHTKFLITYNEEQPTSRVDFKDNNDSITIDLNYNADLLCDISLKVSVNDPTNETDFVLKDDLPLFLVNDITLNMVGPNIELDKLDKDYINFNAMLNNPKSNNSTYNVYSESGTLTCNNGNNFQNMSLCGGVINTINGNSTIKNMTSIIPLPFAFSKSIGNALPLCALNTTHTKAQIIISKKNIDNDPFDSNSNNNEILIGLFKYSIISKYIFLSNQEKLRFKNSKQEYLYERVNVLNNGTSFTEKEHQDGKFTINRLSSNHPIKQIYLYNQETLKFNLLTYNVFVNNEQIFSEPFKHEFFSKVEILNKFKGSIYNGSDTSGNILINNNIALIDFSFKMSEGPSGCISPNSNSIHIQLNIEKVASFNIKIYVVCYYLLTISNENIAYMFD